MVAPADGGGPGRTSLPDQVEQVLLQRTGPRVGPRPPVLLAALTVPLVLLVVAIVVVLRGAAAQSTPAAAVAVAAVPPVVGQPRPLVVHIPAIGVDSPLEPLDVVKGGELAAPKDYGNAGWWEQGVSPGAVGPAVIAGHIDSRSGPAVFFRLRTLVPGDTVSVDRDDGTTVTFAVDRVVTVSKKAFPTAAVYGPTAAPELRLVTCGGAFDKRLGSYDDNTVVFARLVG